MAEIVSAEVYSLPDSMEGLTEESFWRLLDWQTGSARIGRVKKRFEAGLFERTGYDDGHRPTGAEESVIDAGKRFLVTTRPTTKTPAYGDVVAGFSAYLDFLLEQRVGEEALRRDVLMLDGEVYVSLGLLEEKMQSLREECLSGKDGVSQSVKGYLSNGELVEPDGSGPGFLAIGMGTDYGPLTSENGESYWIAVNMLKAWKPLADGFKEEVKEGSLRLLGGEPDRPVAVKYPFGGVVFYHHLEPRQRVAYGSVVSSFDHPGPAKPRKGSKMGDFRKIRMYVEDPCFLEQKELVDSGFARDYMPKKRGDRILARIEGVQDRLKRYSEPSSSLEQNFYARRT